MRTPLPSIAISLAAVSCLAGCGAPFTVKSPLAVYEEMQVFQPAKHPQGNWDKKAELGAEDAWFVSEDYTQLHGWYLPHENPIAVVLLAHGNAGNVTMQAETLRALHDRHRVSVLAFDYRGYGRSEGYPSEVGIIEDARAARAWLARRAKVDEHDIVLLGHSLGGGVMVDLAARDGARGLVLASAFTSLPDIASVHAPLLPAKSLMETRLDSLTKIGDYHGPLLQIHGDHDRVIPYKLGKKLFEAANQPKVFVTKTGAGHDDPMSDEDRRAIDTFFASLPPVHNHGETAELETRLEPARSTASR